MAKINVEHKKKSVWPWIIGVVVAILIIWALFQLFDNDDAQAVPPPPTQSSSVPNQIEPAVPATAYRAPNVTGADIV